MATNASNSTYDDLVQLNDEKAKTLIPLMVFFGMSMVMGIIGNSFVCYIIGFRFQTSNQNILIVSLAILDLISCLLTMPKGIIEMMFSYKFPSDALCKLLRFVAAFTCIGSVFVLVIIAVERYKKICKPLAPQLTQRQTRIALVITLTGAFLLSVPTIFIYGIRTYESPVKGQAAHDCFTSDHMINTPIPIVYTVVLFTIFIIICVIIIVIYGSILYSIKQHRRKMSIINVSVVRHIGARFTNQKRINTPSLLEQVITAVKGLKKSASRAEVDTDHSKTEYERECSLKNLHPSKLQGNVNQKKSLNERKEEGRKDEGNEKNKDELIKKKGNVTSTKKYLSKISYDTTIKPIEESKITIVKDRLDSSSTVMSSYFDYHISEDGHSEKCTGDDSHSNISEVTQKTDLCLSMESENQRTFVISPEVYLEEKCGVFETRSNIFTHLSTSDSTICCYRDICAPEKRNKAECQNHSIQSSKDTDFGAIRSSSQEHYTKTFKSKENNHDKDTKLPNRRKLEPRAKTKATKIAFLVTLVFIVSFLPHLSLRACKNIFKGFDYNLEGAPLILYNLFLRSYYINSIANPIIYGALNIRFRTEVKVLYHRLRFK